MRYTLLYYIVSLLSASALMMMTACDTVGVDICEKDVHGGEMHVRYHWPSGARQTPEKMWIVSRRPADFLRGLHGWFPNELGSDEYTTRGYEVGLYNRDTTTWNSERMKWFEEYATLESDSIHEQRLHRGDFWLMSMNCSKWLKYDNLEDFMQVDSVRLSDMNVNYSPVSTPDSVGEVWRNWVDTNHKYKYSADLGDIFICKQAVDANTDEVLLLDFMPELLSQRLDFKFGIHSDNDSLLVDSVRCELSGVSFSKKVNGGYISVDSEKSIRVLFSLNPEDVVHSGLNYDCTASVAVLGMCFPADSVMQTGPGMLRVSAYTHLITESGGVKSRTYMWSINLWRTLKDHPVTVRTEDGFHFVNSSSHEVLDLPYHLAVKVRDYGNPDEGMDIWPDDGNIDIEF